MWGAQSASLVVLLDMSSIRPGCIRPFWQGVEIEGDRKSGFSAGEIS